MVAFSPRDTTGNHRYQQEGYRGGKFPKRNLILWQVPHLGNQRFIEMYINPQSIATSNRKTISSKRTKGGFLIQYWGEELETLNISGVTGDGGIEALDALFDVYRSEQLAFEEIARQASANVEGQSTSRNLIKRRQPLAPLASSAIMWYMGQGKRGYFTDFQYDEAVNQNGSMSYRMTFVVVEIFGRRRNFMPWHRKPWSTTETPNIVSNGTMSVTGGYPGDFETRVGKLNSPSGRVHKVLRTSVDEETGQEVTVSEDVWYQNPMFDPKYWEGDFQNSTVFPQQSGDGSQNLVQTTEGVMNVNTGEVIAGESFENGRALSDSVGLQLSAEEAGNVQSEETLPTKQAPSSGQKTGEVNEAISDRDVDNTIRSGTNENVSITETTDPNSPAALKEAAKQTTAPPSSAQQFTQDTAEQVAQEQAEKSVTQEVLEEEARAQSQQTTSSTPTSEAERSRQLTELDAEEFRLNNEREQFSEARQEARALRSPESQYSIPYDGSLSRNEVRDRQEQFQKDFPDAQGQSYDDYSRSQERRSSLLIEATDGKLKLLEQKRRRLGG